MDSRSVLSKNLGWSSKGKYLSVIKMKLLSLKKGPTEFGGLNNFGNAKILRLRILVQTFHILIYGNAEGIIQGCSLKVDYF